jgi:hypothetical protein
MMHSFLLPKDAPWHGEPVDPLGVFLMQRLCSIPPTSLQVHPLT